MLVPKWATWEVFASSIKKGLIMYGQMTAGSWIYIGSQALCRELYENLSLTGKQALQYGSLKGTLNVTAALRHGWCAAACDYNE
jgi:urocanate hydratase